MRFVRVIGWLMACSWSVLGCGASIFHYAAAGQSSTFPSAALLDKPSGMEGPVPLLVALRRLVSLGVLARVPAEAGQADQALTVQVSPADIAVTAADPSEPTDLEDVLRWLRTSVAPTLWAVVEDRRIRFGDRAAEGLISSLLAHGAVAASPALRRKMSLPPADVVLDELPF
jgi:hypothetical protein